MPTQAEFRGIAERQAMAKVQQLAEITPNLPLTEYDFYEFFRTTFETSELGRMKRLLPLRKMADNLGLVRRGTMPRRGSRPYFTAEGKVALMFLKMYTGLSCPKLMEQLNGNIHYQMFCDVIIDPVNPLRNYRLLDGIILDIAGKILGEIRNLRQSHKESEDLLTKKEKGDLEIIGKMYEQQRRRRAWSSRRRSTTYLLTGYRSSTSCHSTHSTRGQG